MATMEQDAPQAQKMPPTLGGVVPYLTGGRRRRRQPSTSRLSGRGFSSIRRRAGADDALHLYVNGGSVMMSDAYPEHGHPLTAPQALAASSGPGHRRRVEARG